MPEVFPKAFALDQNYPNPFNPTTVISYQLAVNSLVSLKVYDILGRIVQTLVEGEQPAGSYQATFDGSHLGSGIYISGSEPFRQGHLRQSKNCCL